MQLVDGELILSASDLNNFVACRHLTALDLARVRGEIDAPAARGADAELLAHKGDEHEADFLQSLKDDGREVVEIVQDGRDLESVRAAAVATKEAMRGGAEVIYQGTFLQGNLRGHTDFLFKVDRPSDLGDWSYEVADTKLAKRAKPYYILQLCFYSELLQSVQGGEPPERIHVILGTNEQHSFRLAEFSAYFRHVRDGFLAELEQDEWETYPDPVDHCSICRWSDFCDERRVEDDHLSLVAGMRRNQIPLLESDGIKTLAGLGSAPADLEVPGIREAALGKIRSQAAIQLKGRESGKLEYEVLPVEDKHGFHRLPEPSEGDVFFDMESDPWFEDGLEYLFGFVTIDSGEPAFEIFWGLDRAHEKQAFERFIDYVTERRGQFPDLHVYHYAHYEVGALKRLAGQHGTREEELDELLRGQVFVDLYRVVVEGLRISQPSYGLKKVEGFFMEQRETEVTDGNASVVEFENWLQTGEQKILDRIGEYNRDDCVATWRLREWLLDRRSEAEELTSESIGWFEPERPETSETRRAHREENEKLIAALIDGVPDDLADADEEQKARWLMAQLVEYHNREARPIWWVMFDRFAAEVEDLIDDPDCVGGLKEDPEIPARPEKKSLAFRLRFPPQETKLRASDDGLLDPSTEDSAGTVLAIDNEEGVLELKRGPKFKDVPLPRSLIPGGPYRTNDQQQALRDLAGDIVATGATPEVDHTSARQILLRSYPRIRGVKPGEGFDRKGLSIEELSELVSRLDDSYLFVQGPPGSGKTFRGARVVVALLEQGKRVGVTSTSHKAIHNLMAEVEKAAVEAGVDFAGLKKFTEGNPDSEYESELEEPMILSTSERAELNDPGIGLTGGTAWHYCRDDVDALDYLFIDEAGQISLADAIALSTAARNVVLLGDPQQLPQVAQASHPAGAEISVLQHLLEDSQTIPRNRGVFLDDTYRLNPEITSFVSELMYDGRLRSAPGRERQRVEATGEITGAGLRWMPVEHEGREQSSPEEANRIAAAIEPLLDGARYTDCDGEEHSLTPDDIMVVTPFNAQVRCLEEQLPSGVRTGTVDKFQGQQAQVVFYSMATSGDGAIPRNIEFLFSRNRLNVAISRARCLAVLVASPRLLDLGAKSIEQMRLVNALCRFSECAAVPSA